MESGFTIPKKKTPKKDNEDSSSPSKPAGRAARSNRKVLPTRASREQSLTPEFEAMSKLLTQFYARADAGKICLFVLSVSLVACFYC